MGRYRVWVSSLLRSPPVADWWCWLPSGGVLLTKLVSYLVMRSAYCVSQAGRILASVVPCC